MIIVSILTLLFVACGKSESKVDDLEFQKKSISEIELPDHKAEDTTTGPVPQNQKPGNNNSSKGTENADWNKKIIKSSQLEVEVKDYDQYYIFLKEKTRALGRIGQRLRFTRIRKSVIRSFQIGLQLGW